MNPPALDVPARSRHRAASARVVPALISALLAVSGCSRPGPRTGGRVPIAVAAVERRDVPYEIDATGTVEPVQSATVTPQVGGLVTRVAFREGDEVAAGALLFQIDRRPFAAAAARAEAELDRALAQAETARLEWERSRKLSDQSLVSPAELDQKRVAWQSAAATARSDSAALTSARLDLANAAVRAPISGRTGARLVNVGDVVRANEAGTGLVSIVQLRPIRARFTLPQSELAALRQARGRDLTVEAATGSADSAWIAGRLVFIDNRVDPASGTLLLKGEFANRDDALWPGAFVRVRLRLFDEHGATVVPASAVTNSQSGTYCYVVKPDTTVEVRAVDVRRNWRDLAVIAHGLEPGETVVTDGQLRLTPGARAVIRPAATLAEGATP